MINFLVRYALGQTVGDVEDEKEYINITFLVAERRLAIISKKKEANLLQICDWNLSVIHLLPLATHSNLIVPKSPNVCGIVAKSTRHTEISS